ncbi:hypothetical protein [Prosthecobacter sp.]|uniref:hypothetical protein n=1 Tax=Prosthecobacter sp. TaxID=1965333 RepID=UPI0037C8B607
MRRSSQRQSLVPDPQPECEECSESEYHATIEEELPVSMVELADLVLEFIIEELG